MYINVFINCVASGGDIRLGGKGLCRSKWDEWGGGVGECKGCGG